MNSNYRKLAHERAILMALVNVAKEKFLPLEGEDSPAVTIECEELPRNESEVPEDAVIDVVMKLQRLALNRESEMTKYKFVAQETNDEQEWESASKGSSPPAAAPNRKGKGKGSQGASQPAANQGAGGKPGGGGANAAARAPAAKP